MNPIYYIQFPIYLPIMFLGEKNKKKVRVISMVIGVLVILSMILLSVPSLAGGGHLF